MNVFLLLHACVVIAFTTRILLRDDLTPTARLAWFIVLLIDLPYRPAFRYAASINGFHALNGNDGSPIAGVATQPIRNFG